MDIKEKLIEFQNIITCPNEICNFCEYFKNNNACEKHKKEVIADNMIANGVTTVRHGQWIYNIEGGEYVCSACGKNALSFKIDTLYDVDLYETCLTDYCPNCGARMDEEVNT